jgi:hypothetical protein
LAQVAQLEPQATTTAVQVEIQLLDYWQPQLAVVTAVAVDQHRTQAVAVDQAVAQVVLHNRARALWGQQAVAQVVTLYILEHFRAAALF